MFRVTPIPEHAFLEQAVLEGEIDRRLLQRRGFVPQVPDLRAGGLAGRVAGEPLLARATKKYPRPYTSVGARVVLRPHLYDFNRLDHPLRTKDFVD